MPKVPLALSGRASSGAGVSPTSSGEDSRSHHRRSLAERPTSPRNLAKSAGIKIQVSADDDVNEFEDTIFIPSSNPSSPTSPHSASSSHPPPLDLFAALDTTEALRPLRQRRGAVHVSGRGYLDDQSGTSTTGGTPPMSRPNLGEDHSGSKVNLVLRDWGSKVRSSFRTLSLSSLPQNMAVGRRR